MTTLVNKEIYKRHIIICGAASALTTTLVLSLIFFGYVLPLQAQSGSTPVFEHPASPYSYLIWTDGTTYYAKNGETGAIEYSGTDAVTVITNAINSIPAAPDEQSYGGGKIFIARGNYSFNSKLFINHKDHLWIEGEGYGTSLVATGNFPVIHLNYSSFVHIRNMEIVGGGKTNALAHGIKLEVVNRVYLQNLAIRRTRCGIVVWGAYLTTIENVKVFGTGTEQNFRGIKTMWRSSERINEIIVRNTQVLGVEDIGILLQGANGASFVDVAVIDSGNTAWYIGGEASGQWSGYLHFTRVSADSPSFSTAAGFHFEKGTADKLETIQITNLWAGGYRYGIILDGVNDVAIANVYIKDVERNAIEIKGVSNRTHIQGGEIWNWDRADSGSYHGIYVHGVSNDISIDGTQFYNENLAQYSVYVGSSSRTMISDVNTYNAQIIRDTGTDTKVTHSWNGTNWIATYP